MKKNKTREYAVKYLFDSLAMVIEEIAKELNIPVLEVEEILKDHKPKAKKKNNPKSQDLMIRHTSAKKTNNVSIMTESASQYNDAAKKALNSKINSKNQNSIFRPRNG
jgi:hypothetical protein